jgi:NDP-sugar pyrophosphorylase family protein
MIPAVILCGGQATRLYPITESMPKALVEINGVPFIDYQLSFLYKQGVEDIILCVGNHGKQIEDYLGSSFTCSYDGPTPLGTGGAIKKALPLLPNNFIVLNGDTLFKMDLKQEVEAYSHSQRFVWMYTHLGVDCGLYLMHKYAFNDFDGVFSLWSLLNHMEKKRELFRVKSDVGFVDMGTPVGIKEMEKYLRD